MLLDDLVDYLTSQGVATTSAPLYKGLLPDEPDLCGVVYETGGLPPVHAMNASAGQAKVERPRVQVVWRASEYDYATARDKAHAAFKLLDGLPARSINGTEYLWGAAVQSPFLMGRDELKRPLIACNYDLVKALTA